MRTTTILGTLLLVGGVGFLAAALLAGSGAPPSSAAGTRSVMGNEAPREDCVYANESRYNVCNYGAATLRDAYLRYQDLLGPPVSGFDSRCQTFTFAKVCFNPTNPEGWQVEFANLGAQDLLASGYTLQPGADLHPAVRDWLLGQLELGLDTARVIGRPISPARCVKGTGRCSQSFDKTRFDFPDGAQSGLDVQRAPLGLLSVHPEAGSPSTASPIGPFHLVGAGVVALAGLFLLIGGRQRRQAGAFSI